MCSLLCRGIRRQLLNGVTSNVAVTALAGRDPTRFSSTAFSADGNRGAVGSPSAASSPYAFRWKSEEETHGVLERDVYAGSSSASPAATDAHIARAMAHFDRLTDAGAEDGDDHSNDDLHGDGEEAARLAATTWRDHADAAKEGDEELRAIDANAPLPEYVIRRQEALLGMPTADVVEVVTHYLRATANVKLVSAEEEHAMFPAVMRRLNEFHVSQLLDMVEGHWARSTLVRYGVAFQDAVRDRIADIANEAVHHSSEGGAAPALVNESSGHDGGPAGVPDDATPTKGKEAGTSRRHGIARQDPFAAGGEFDFPDDDESYVDNDDGGASGGAVYTDEAAAQAELGARDPIIAAAVEELDAPTVLRCIVVMGMSAGHRKRDLDFFSAMGRFFAYHVNQYRDPHDLVRVLTALARAKIVPSRSFLALLARRFPVVSKRTPLEPLPCYRAMVNFGRMGHDHMDTYRFFADYMITHMERTIAEEAVRVRHMQSAKTSSTAGMKEETPLEAKEKEVLVEGRDDFHRQQTDAVRAAERVVRLTGLTPSMLTRWLLILARHGAPHQPYLRPLVRPVLVPLLPDLPPPSRTRLLLALRLFRSADLELVEPFIDLLARERVKGTNDSRARGSGESSFLDVLTMLSILAMPDAPVPANLDKFLQYCVDVCTEGVVTTELPARDAAAVTVDATATATAGSDTVTNDSDKDHAPPGLVLRPADMCTVANYLLQLQRRPEISLEALAPLTTLMELFARRLTYLVELRVVSLVHVDLFADICLQQQHPDASASIERMRVARRAVAASVSAATCVSGDSDVDGEEMYYRALDIDVRDTFFKILTVNGTNTYGSYRPLPGPLQLDFREWLTSVSALDLLLAVDLHERACPGRLRATPGRFLARAVLQKLGMTGEEVVSTDAHRLELRPPRELLLTRDDLMRLAALVTTTPLRQVRDSPIVWSFIAEKAARLRVLEVATQATQKLVAAHGVHG